MSPQRQAVPSARLDEDVHRALRVAARHLADDAGQDLVGAGELQVEQAQRPRRVQAVDVVLDVLGRVLRAHQAGGRELELAPGHHHRRRGEAIVLAGVVDVRMRVQDPADVAETDAVPGQLALEPLLLGRVADHAQAPHDLRARRAGVHEDRIASAEQQVRPGLRPRDDAHLVREHEEARLDVDVHQIEQLDLVAHEPLLPWLAWTSMSTASRRRSQRRRRSKPQIRERPAHRKRGERRLPSATGVVGRCNRSDAVRLSQVMTCPSCGTENKPGARFCGGCAARLAQTCPACGAVNDPGMRFCNECASPLSDGVVPVRPVAGVASAGSPAPTAERRLVSVLFADLVGFTTASETRDAEDTRELLTRYFDISRMIVERYGGTVEKFIGDAVMAVWGTPTATEDDAERAVRPHSTSSPLFPRWRRGRRAELRARAGVLTGEAAVTVGAEGQGMVAGDLVNTASRIQSAAEPGTVLVGERPSTRPRPRSPTRTPARTSSRARPSRCSSGGRCASSRARRARSREPGWRRPSSAATASCG